MSNVVLFSSHGFPKLLFQELNTLCDRYIVEKNEFVFNRKSDNFHLILNCYQGGKLHFGDGGCAIKFTKVSCYAKDVYAMNDSTDILTFVRN